MPSSASITPRPSMLKELGRLTPLTLNKFPNKLALNVPNNQLRNVPFWFFTSFLTVSLRPVINKQIF